MKSIGKGLWNMGMDQMYADHDQMALIHARGINASESVWTKIAAGQIYDAYLFVENAISTGAYQERYDFLIRDLAAVTGGLYAKVAYNWNGESLEQGLEEVTDLLLKWFPRGSKVAQEDVADYLYSGIFLAGQIMTHAPWSRSPEEGIGETFRVLILQDTLSRMYRMMGDQKTAGMTEKFMTKIRKTYNKKWQRGQYDWSKHGGCSSVILFVLMAGTVAIVGAGFLLS